MPPTDMQNPDVLFQQAGAFCARGAFAQAADLYHQLLTMLPGHPQILAGLGNAELGLGQVDQAIATFQRALAAPQPQPDVLCNLARALRAAKRYEEGLRAVDQALSLVPSLFPAWNCRGNILLDMERLAEAVAAYEQAVLLMPNDARVHFNLANALRRSTCHAEALECYRRALALAPDHVGARKNLALTYFDLGLHAEALVEIDRAIALDLQDTQASDARGQILQALGRFDEAIAELTRAIALAPNSAVAHSNRGVPLHAIGRLDEALADFDRALELDPAYADAIVNRGTVLKDMGRISEVEAVYAQALKVAPDHPEANWNWGLLALLRGDFETGWRNYEWRWKSKARSREYLITDKPQWRGEDIRGKTIMLWREQGFGDYIQFCRYVPMVTALGAKVILDPPPRLKPLIARLGDFAFIEAQEATFDYHCPMMSLPLAFGTTLETIPAAPYLTAASEKIAAFDTTLGPGPRVGLVWSANIHYFAGRDRIMPVEFLEPLLDLPFAFHVVQKDFTARDEAWLGKFPHLAVHADEQNDFHDAAALISAMDLIITVDTSVAHLAGALGKPVFLLLPHSADWRWLLKREDSPWYPTMRLFRQPARGDWAGAVAKLRSVLQGGLPKPLPSN